jgi:NADH-quinone oxidoreductase subunit M
MHGPPRGVLLQTDPAVPAEPVPGGSGATATLTAPAPAATRLRITDLDRREIGVVAPLVALIIVLGVYPEPLIDLIRPAVIATISDVGGHDGVQPHTTDARPTSERGNN